MPEKQDQQMEKKIILIAEDDDTSFALFQVYLSKEKFRLLRTTNGEQTIEIFRKNPDTALILMDLKMPLMDGYEATRQIKKLNPAVPIIAQTAYALAGDNKKALDAGCDDYLAKPIKKMELLEKINALLKE